MSKDIYVADLLSRYAGHSFTEIMHESTVEVLFLDDESNQVARAIAQAEGVVINAYRQIRRQVLEGENPLFAISSAQRDALTNLTMGTFIDNTTTGAIEVFNGSDWMNAGGGGRMGDVAYGEMYQDNDDGDIIPRATGMWDSGQAGILDANGLITYTGNSLNVEVGGAGDYAVSFNLNFTSSAGETCTANLHVGGNDIEKIKDSHPGDSAERGDLSATGILTLADEGRLELHVDSESPTDVIMVYQVNLNIRRIS